MKIPLIKICGISSPELAHQTALIGAHWIGIVFHPLSRRSVTLTQAQEIAVAAHQAKAKVVGVFVDQNVDQINDIILKCKIDIIQLHGMQAKLQHYLLSDSYPRIYVQPVLENGQIVAEELLTVCNPIRDYVLFDNVKPGHGRCFDWNSLHYQTNFPMGIGGGLNANNVRRALEQFQPAFVDVSSGVENDQGEKTLPLIKKFIDAVLT